MDDTILFYMHYLISMANNTSPHTFDDIHKEYSEEQRKAKERIIKLRYQTWVFVVWLLLVLLYSPYRTIMQNIERTRTQITTLKTDVKKLEKEKREASYVVNFFEEVETNTNLYNCLNIPVDIKKKEQQKPVIVWTGENVVIPEAPKFNINKCLESMTWYNTLEVEVLRAAYSMQTNDQWKLEFDQKNVLKLLDQHFLNDKTRWSLTEVSFGDMEAVQWVQNVVEIPMAVSLTLEDYASLVRFIWKIEVQKPVRAKDWTDKEYEARPNFFIINDITYDIVKHDEQQDVEIDMSLYLYSTQSV